MDAAKLAVVLADAQKLQEQALELQKISEPSKEDLPKAKAIIEGLEKLKTGMQDAGIPGIMLGQLDGNIKEVRKLQAEWEKQIGE